MHGLNCDWYAGGYTVPYRMCSKRNRIQGHPGRNLFTKTLVDVLELVCLHAFTATCRNWSTKYEYFITKTVHYNHDNDNLLGISSSELTHGVSVKKRNTVKLGVFMLWHWTEANRVCACFHIHFVSHSLIALCGFLKYYLRWRPFIANDVCSSSTCANWSSIRICVPFFFSCSSVMIFQSWLEIVQSIISVVEW